MKTEERVKVYIESSLSTLGYVCPSVGPIKCATNQLVFKDIALDMGLEYTTLGKRTVMVKCKQI